MFCQCTDTIISWRDPERSTELALSFQETAGCSYVWLVKKFLPLSMSIPPSFLHLPILLTGIIVFVIFRDQICSMQRNLHFGSLNSKNFRLEYFILTSDYVIICD